MMHKQHISIEILGGFFASVISALNLGNMVETALSAAVGFGVTLTLKLVLKWVKSDLKSMLKNLINRITSPTPTFFKKVAGICLTVAAIGGAIVGFPPLAAIIPAWVGSACMTAGGVGTAISILTTDKDAVTKATEVAAVITDLSGKIAIAPAKAGGNLVIDNTGQVQDQPVQNTTNQPTNQGGQN